MTEEKPNGQPPERWAIVSLLGHQERVGRVSEETVAGAAMLRVDIPLEDGSFSTRHVGGAAIYEITYVDEATARAVARARPAHPISIWSAQRLGLLPKPEVAELPAPEGFLAEDDTPDDEIDDEDKDPF